mgnify:CR=1 FL=1
MDIWPRRLAQATSSPGRIALVRQLGERRLNSRQSLCSALSKGGPLVVLIGLLMTTLMRDTETDEQISIIDSGDALTIVDDIATISPGTTSRVLRSAAGAFAFLIVAFALFLFVASGLIAQRDQVVLERTMRDQLARAVAPIGGNIRVGSPVAVLEIPALDIRQIVAEGSTPEVTKSGAGHVRATPMPGQPGNSVVMARRSTFGAPFRHIDSLIKGDIIRVVTGQGRSQYRVTGVERVPAGDPSLFATSSRAGVLSLVTADDALSPSGYSVTRARLVTPAFQSTRHARTISATETGLVGQGGGLTALAVALMLLALIGAGTTWLFLSWRPWSAYLVAAPVILAGIWLVSNLASGILPSTI